MTVTYKDETILHKRFVDHEVQIVRRTDYHTAHHTAIVTALPGYPPLTDATRASLERQYMALWRQYGRVDVQSVADYQIGDTHANTD